jgi:hypothetical protein
VRYNSARERPRGGDDYIIIGAEIGTVQGAVATWSLLYALSWVAAGRYRFLYRTHSLPPHTPPHPWISFNLSALLRRFGALS